MKLGKQKYNVKIFYDDGYSKTGKKLDTDEIIWKWDSMDPNEKYIGISVGNLELENSYNILLRKEKLNKINEKSKM